MPPNLRSVIERVTRGGRSVVSSRNFSSCPNCGNDSKEAGGRVVAAARSKRVVNGILGTGFGLNNTRRLLSSTSSGEPPKSTFQKVKQYLSTEAYQVLKVFKKQMIEKSVETVVGTFLVFVIGWIGIEKEKAKKYEENLLLKIKKVRNELRQLSSKNDVLTWRVDALESKAASKSP